jgi:hypothetical protein
LTTFLYEKKPEMRKSEEQKKVPRSVEKSSRPAIEDGRRQ